MASSQAPATGSTPAALEAAIKRLDGAAAIVTADEVYPARCEAEHRRDQILRADFDEA